MNKISFLIAAYNEEEYIRECIESCLNQEEVEVEVCVVDDGSLDGTSRIIKEMASVDKRIVYLIFEENKGKVAAFNAAYELSTAPFLALIGADDVNLPDRVKKSVSILLDGKFNLVYGNYYVCSEDMIVKYECTVASNFSPENIIFNNKMSGGTVVFDRFLSRDVFPIPSGLKFEDWWIAFIAVMKYKIGYINQPLIYYRHHSGNDSVSSYFFGVKTKDFIRHAPYYDAFHSFLIKSGGGELNYIALLRDAKFFKIQYTNAGFINRVKSGVEYLRAGGLPRSLYGYFALFLITPLGSFPFDIVLFIKNKIGR